MRFSFKYFILILLSSYVFSQDTMGIRAQTYNSYLTSNDLLQRLNNPEFFEVSQDLFGTDSVGTRSRLNDDLIAQSNEYMNYYNNRAQILGIVDEEGIRTNQANIDALDLIPKKQQELAKEMKRSFNTAMMNSLDELAKNPTQDTAAKHKTFSEFMNKNGLSSLQMDILDHVDNGLSSPAKKIKEMMSVIEANREVLLKSGIPELESLAKSVSSVKSNSESQLNYLEKEKVKLEKEVTSFDPKKSAQAKMDYAFLKDKKLLPVTSLSDFTQMELHSLNTMKDSPLRTNDYDKAIEIINGKRAQDRTFIKNISAVSNELTSAAAEGRSADLTTKLSSISGETRAPSKKLNLHIEETSNAVSGKENIIKYHNQINSRISVEANRGGIDARLVSNVESRLAIVDSLTGGGINLSDSKEMDVSRSLSSIPKNDLIARKAFAKHILENGTDAQRRSLKINDFSLGTMVEKEIEFKLKCKKVPSKW